MTINELIPGKWYTSGEDRFGIQAILFEKLENCPGFDKIHYISRVRDKVYSDTPDYISNKAWHDEIREVAVSEIYDYLPADKRLDVIYNRYSIY